MADEHETSCVWQPIETAPKDGTRILLAHKPLRLSGNTQSTAHFISRNDGSACWCVGRHTNGQPIILPVLALFWRHLPDDPVTEAIYAVTWSLAERDQTEGEE